MTIASDQKQRPCALCGATAAMVSSNSLELCLFCHTALIDSASPAGRLLRSSVRAIRRRLLFKNEMREPWKDDARPEQQKNAQQRYRNTPDGRAKSNARRAVFSAIKRGILIRPDSCQRCGFIPNKNMYDGRSEIHFHHTAGYVGEARLIGDWLCRTCHHDVDEAEKKK